MRKKSEKQEVQHFNDKVVSKAFKLSREKEGKSLEQLIMKTGEEYGEMCQAFLSMTGAPANKWRGKTQEDFFEEMIDLHLCNIAVMAKSGLTQAKYAELMRKKLKSWESKIDGTYKKPTKQVFILGCDGSNETRVFTTREGAAAEGGKREGWFVQNLELEE